MKCFFIIKLSVLTQINNMPVQTRSMIRNQLKAIERQQRAIEMNRQTIETQQSTIEVHEPTTELLEKYLSADMTVDMATDTDEINELYKEIKTKYKQYKWINLGENQILLSSKKNQSIYIDKNLPDLAGDKSKMFIKCANMTEFINKLHELINKFKDAEEFCKIKNIIIKTVIIMYKQIEYTFEINYAIHGTGISNAMKNLLIASFRKSREMRTAIKSKNCTITYTDKQISRLEKALDDFALNVVQYI